MKAPWMPMYWPNYLADTAHFTTVEHGAYLLLIAHYWCNGGLPDDDKQLIRIARVRFQDWKRMRPVLSSKFEPGWRHKRIDLELAKSLKLQEAGKESDRKYRTSRQRNVNVVPPHTNTNTNKDSKSQNVKTAEAGSAGYVASPHTEQFKKWKAWAYEQPSRALWRELQQREQEGRPFNFKSQWPPN
jgi:uncharacterized protein YdaU (DUF1376 family)